MKTRFRFNGIFLLFILLISLSTAQPDEPRRIIITAPNLTEIDNSQPCVSARLRLRESPRVRRDFQEDHIVSVHAPAARHGSLVLRAAAAVSDFINLGRGVLR